ncbi:MAG: response regulator [Tepidisphaeraceae bacterium]|jgi:CheY-like chemotaxis protein
MIDLLNAGERQVAMDCPSPEAKISSLEPSEDHYQQLLQSLKEARSALEEARESAEAANRLKDRFFAVLSHELRTPLTPVLMALAAIEAGPELPPGVRDDIAMIRRNVELESKLIDDLLKHIFNAFEQGNAEAARQFGGLGLGLAISKALVELHGSKICVQSGGAGTGSVFTIELPALEATMENAATGKSAQADARRAPLRLLVVEDHADTATMLAKLLGSAGYSVKTAASAAGALELASREPFDLLVSDIGLPDATGYQLMRQIKERYGTNGIAMSGYGMDEDIRKSREAGFSDHLVKPISFAQLDQAIHRLLGCGKQPPLL